MDIVVKGRNVEVPDHFRQHVSDKLAPSERLDSRVIRLDVELMHEKNPRQAATCQRVEITVRSKGPVIRAEACAESFYAALDTAVLKLEARLRKQHDRRRVHHGGKTPPSVAEATAGLSQRGSGPAPEPSSEAPVPAPGPSSDAPGPSSEAPVAAAPGPSSEAPVALLDREPLAVAQDAASADALGAQPGRAGADDTAALIVRDKTHVAQPMTTEDALHEMELVGHDFFLFMDAACGLPSVVYRRHGYDYGVLRLARE